MQTRPELLGSVRITLTGVDTREKLSGLAGHVRRRESYSQHPNRVEIGLLYSAANPGKRYRLLQEEHSAHYSELWNAHVPLALHASGREAVENVAQGKVATSVYSRIQLNGVIALETMERAINTYVRPLVVQVNARAVSEGDVTRWVCPKHVQFTRVHMLMDSSGGRGVYPAKWELPEALRNYGHVGFAGGIGRHNMRQTLKELVELRGSLGFWIDMEQSLRDAEDEFDLQVAIDTIGEFDRALWDLAYPPEILLRCPLCGGHKVRMLQQNADEKFVCCCSCSASAFPADEAQDLHSSYIRNWNQASVARWGHQVVELNEQGVRTPLP